MEPVWTIDFETMPIGPRPEHYPPRPVGLAYRTPSGMSGYCSWGHPSGNDSTRQHAVDLLNLAWRTGAPILMHNAKFDLAICYEHFGLPVLPWARVHDTMFLAFLLDPYARTLGLKELARVWLQMPPDERDAVAEWVLAHKKDLPPLHDGKRPTKKNAGAWIGYAPVELVGPYAIGDTERTWRLFQTMMPAVRQAGMQDAYDVERRLLPILMENERIGVRIDRDRLEQDVETYSRWFTYVEDAMRGHLNAQGLNFDADADVADVLESRGIVTEWKETATGKRSVSKKNLHPDQFTDKRLASALGYRNRLKTVLETHMKPMLAQAQARGGYAMGEWNQVASPEGGTRTGRPSMRGLNLLNVSKDFDDRNDGYEHPAFIEGLPLLPMVRGYILPDEGHVINGRDFSGQELRVFAHFEQGDLMRQYLADPEVDVHFYIGNKIADATGDDYWRTKEARKLRTKTLNFQAIYGGGIPAAQEALRCTYEEAAKFKAMHDAALPGRRILSDQLSYIVRTGQAVRTLGGRLFVRPPFKTQKRTGQLSDADYVLINYLVQGSSADMTKRAILAMHDDPDYSSRFMVQVYDEIVVSSPAEDAERQSLVMKRAMETSTPLRVKMLTDPERGPNWGAMEDLKDG